MKRIATSCSLPLLFRSSLGAQAVSSLSAGRAGRSSAFPKRASRCTHVRVVDGTGKAPLEDQTIVIENGKIASVAPGGERDGACRRARRSTSPATP